MERMNDAPKLADDLQAAWMVAAARLAAHYVDAALRAGMDRDEINASLRRIARDTVIAEVWVSDERGRIAYSTVEDSGFAFPTDPSGDDQASPFAALLTGDRDVVVQDPGPRDLDGAVFRYVAVAGVDRPRIVQVGVAATP